MSGPLSHLTVLDLSRILAGPWAGQVLADLGADVIKVERPGVGDDTRSWGPPYLDGPKDQSEGQSAYFLSVNRGKRSIAVDLSTTRGQQIVRAIAAKADIVLENFKAGTLNKYGLGYQDLKLINDGIIYCSITGFGQTGPRKDHAAYDFMIQAMGGLMSVTGERDHEPGGGPQKVGVPIVDIMTGMYATIGVLAAVERRRENGQGEYIDLAMLDVQVGFLANQAMNYLVSGDTPTRKGNRHPNIQPQDVFKCENGYLALAVGNDGQFRQLCEALAQPALADDERYANNEDRVRNVETLRDTLSTEFAKEPVDHWVEVLSRRAVPCGPINSIPTALQDKQVQHREMVRDIVDSAGLTVPQVVSPLHLTNTPLAFDRAPPRLGEHTDDILRELGMPTEE